MRPASSITALSVLLCLLTWLAVRALNTDAERYDRAFGALDRFTTQENALRRDVLSARAGILRDYDPLVQGIAALNGSLDQLRHTATTVAEAAAIEQLARSVAQQEELIERFKSDNALLRNSLAYFGLFSGHFASSDRPETLVPVVGALSAAMLRLTLCLLYTSRCV